MNAQGHAYVDWRLVLALAGPLIANSAIQAALNLTDTWFVGQISTNALAGMGAIHWLTIVFSGLLGGVGMAVQTLVAQAFGGRRYLRASQATWTALWAALFTTPVFVVIGLCGEFILKPFGLQPEVQALALQFWQPRMLGAALGVALWGTLGFFNGIGPCLGIYFHGAIVVSPTPPIIAPWLKYNLPLPSAKTTAPRRTISTRS